VKYCIFRDTLLLLLVLSLVTFWMSGYTAYKSLKKHQFIHLLTAAFKDLHVKNSKNHKKVILFSSTLTHSQCDAGNITFYDFCCF